MAAFNPVAAIRFGLSITRTLGSLVSIFLRSSLVPSSDMPSATITSKPPLGASCASTEERHASISPTSLRQGITMLTSGSIAGDTLIFVMLSTARALHLGDHPTELAVGGFG